MLIKKQLYYKGIKFVRKKVNEYDTICSLCKYDNYLNDCTTILQTENKFLVTLCSNLTTIVYKSGTINCKFEYNYFPDDLQKTILKTQNSN